MTKEEWEDILGGIEAKDFDYYFAEYTDPEEFEDKRLRLLAERYRAARTALNNYVQEVTAKYESEEE